MKPRHFILAVSVLLIGSLIGQQLLVRKPESQALAQPVSSTMAPVTVATRAQMANVSVRNGTVVINTATTSDGGLFVYRQASTSTVDNINVIDGPNSAGRFVRFGGSSSQISVDTVSDLRSLVDEPPETVYVKGHTTAHDGGGGFFQQLGTGADTDDVDAGGDDDNGWHIVTTDGVIYGRIDSRVTPQQFGAQPVATAAAAASASDLASTMQRFIDFTLYPQTFNGWDYRTEDLAWGLDGVASDGFWRCESTLTIDLDDNVIPTWENNKINNELVFVGKVFTPNDDDIEAFVINGHRNSGNRRMVLACYKQRSATGDIVWSENTYPDRYESDATYRAWAATTKFYKNETIKHEHGSGETYLYICDTTGTTAGSAPTHTTGTVTDGTVDLNCLGTVRTTDGRLMNDHVADNEDIGIRCDDLSGVRELHVSVDGYMVGLALYPKDTSSSWCAWNWINVTHMFGCKIAYLNARYRAHHTVADQAARLALTGLPVGARVFQQDDAVNDYILNVEGGEATVNNWTAVAAYTSDRFANDNTVAMGLSIPNVSAGLLETNAQSVYGVVITGFGTTDGNTNNYVRQLSLEFAAITGNAEIVQALFYHGNENTVECRNESPTLGAGMKCARHVSRTDNPTYNVVRAGRTGELIDADTWHLNENNGYFNAITQGPHRQESAADFQLRSFTEDAGFSGFDRVYFKTISIWPLIETAATTWAPYKTTSGSIHTEFHPDDNSWTFAANDTPGVVIALPDNRQGLAQIRFDTFYSPSSTSSDSNRIITRLLDTDGSIIDPDDSPAFPRVPLMSPISTYQKFQSGSDAYQRTQANRRIRHMIGVEPWVPQVFVGVQGERVRGFRVTVYGVDNARIYSPAHGGVNHEHNGKYVDEVPERGLFTAPAEVLIRDGTDQNLVRRLDKPADGNTYYATSGEQGVITPDAGAHQWAHDGAAQGSAEIFEYDGVSTWNSIATGAYYTVPTDWVGEQQSVTKTLTESAATDFVRMTVVPGASAGAVIHYTVYADDGSDYQTRTGSINVSFVNTSGSTTTGDVGTVVNEAFAESDGASTLTVTFTVDATPTDGVDIQADATSSLTQTTLAIDYQVDVLYGDVTVTPQ